jgi:hypothetical protein
VPRPSNFGAFCEAAVPFWQTNTLPEGEAVVIVELFPQDRRVLLRNLTVANALRRYLPARLVVLTGIDEGWSRIWPDFDLEQNIEIARAYGAEEILDAHALVDARLRGEGEELAPHRIPQQKLDQIVDATTCRMELVPRVDWNEEVRERRAVWERRCEAFGRLYESLFSTHRVAALVTSHVDYGNFGLAVETARQHRVPVLFPQSTGGLKSYAIFPEHDDPSWPVRAGLTRRIGAFFEERIWPHKELLRPVTELTQHRAKQTLGRPSWWRTGQGWSSIDMASPEEREAIRVHAAAEVGLDPDKPVVTVFNHAVSDALGTNHEAFADLAEWFERTAEYAADHPEVGWLFLDHPSQPLYDAVGFFDSVAARHAAHSHLRFRQSLELSKNFVTALTDLVVTVRGSVSNEYPALGIPALQAGWSEWSQCGFTTVAETPEAYLAELDRHLAALGAGEVLVTPEQVERARLWTWFYRSASDVPSGVVPHWHIGDQETLFNMLPVQMRQVEGDAEPAFPAVRRLWHRTDPFLTRTDWTLPVEHLHEQLAPAGAL